MDRQADSGRPLDVLCVEIVERYHASIHRALPGIRDELAALCGSGASQSLHDVRRAFADLADQIEGHLAKEEHLLFPAFEALAAAERDSARRPPATFVTLLHPIRSMEAEHLRIETTLRHLRDLALEVTEPESLAPGWRRCLAGLSQLEHELIEHHRTEDQIIFPQALELERRLL